MINNRSQTEPLFTQSEFHDVLGGIPVRYISQPGIEFWDQIPPAGRLIVEYIPITNTRNVLLRGVSHGAWAAAVALKSPESQFTLADNNYLHCQLAEKTLQINHVQNATIDLDLMPAAKYDLIAILLPKGRKLARRWLAESFGSLNVGGQLYLAGSNQAGIQSVARDATELFAPPLVLGYKKGNRILRFTKVQTDNQPDWFFKPGIQPGSWYEFSTNLQEKRLNICSMPGEFSYNQIDPGTRLLITHLPSTISGRVLDFGCGTGILGFAAIELGADTVDMVDIDRYAIASARQNATINGYANCNIIHCADLSPVLNRKYTLILTNPPFHSGRIIDYSTTHQFIHQARRVLQENGELMLVANRFINYEDFLHESYSHVRCLFQDQRYKILCAAD